MSGALDRLLARATGRQASRLRPRQPSLFEPDPAGPAASEVWAESSTESVDADPQQPGPPPLQPQTETATETLPVDDDAPARSVAPEQSFPATPASLQPTLARSTESKATSSHEVPKPPSKATLSHAVSEPLLKAPAAAPRAANERERGEPTQHQAERVGTAAPQADRVTRSPPRKEPPAPEGPRRRDRPSPLPTEPALDHRALAPARPAPAVLSAQRPQPAPAVTAEPEIRIHIGRLEVHAPLAAPAPRPVRPERPRPERSLSDYLRKRGT